MPMLPERGRLPAAGVGKNRDYGQGERMRHSSRWLKLRRYVLAVEPLCRTCRRMGRFTPATDVDHVDPHRGDPEKFFDLANLQPLCKACHSRKTALEDGGFGNPVKAAARRRERG